MAAQVREAEMPHLEAGEPLMLRAAHGLADEIRRCLLLRKTNRRVLMLVGSGNNGADALFAAAELAAAGIEVQVIPVGERMHPGGASSALESGACLIEDDFEIALAAGQAGVIVDGILGTGSGRSPALRGRAREVALLLLPSVRAGGPTVVAVDLPSGVHPDTGEAPDQAVLPADVTVTFGGCKAGLLRGAGARLAGRIRVVDIGIGDELARMVPAV